MQADRTAQYSVGDRIEGRDDHYECDLAGVVKEVRDMGDGDPWLHFTNELPGPFEGKIVALRASAVSRS